MIVPMKKVLLVVLENRREKALKALRKLGLLHISEFKGYSPVGEQLDKELRELKRCERALLAYTAESQSLELSFADLHQRVQTQLALRADLNEALTKLESERQRIEPWGDFSPHDVALLDAAGVHLQLGSINTKELPELDSEFSYLVLGEHKKRSIIALVGSEVTPPAAFAPFTLPTQSLGELRSEIASHEQQLAEIETTLGQLAQQRDLYPEMIASLEQELRFDEVSTALTSEQEVAYVSGFIPTEQVEAFKKASDKEKWGYLISDPNEEDQVPTLVRNKRWIDTIAPIFTIMGTVPGYHEYDISMWFLIFFTLFFAMIVGDAAYGLIFLLAGGIFHRKVRQATNAVILIYVLGAGTLIWGSLTGTWFGSKEILLALPFLQKIVIPQLSNYPELFNIDPQTAQNSVMKFCFIIGTLQLSLACVMNIVRKLPRKDLSAVADFGWFMMLDSLYFLVLALVINQPVSAQVLITVVAVAFLLIVLFGAQEPGTPFGQGIAKGFGGLFTTFLDSISAFSNIISYIRLFAVGMASLAIAQSFNDMASSLLQGFAFPAGILVLIIGHGLNLVMGVLSVVVHGVRLNLLEFSGQLGMEWTGVAYDPFREKHDRSETL